MSKQLGAVPENYRLLGSVSRDCGGGQGAAIGKMQTVNDRL
jgi:hypothetical protein